MKPLAQWRDAAQFLDVRGHQIAWWSNGDNDEAKPWLLLIHGYPTSSWDWTALWPSLTQHFRLAALDMLGFGLSDKPADITYSIFDQADLQEALLEHLGVGEAHIFAHDYGDTVAQELLARQIDRTLSFALKSICFLNGGLFPEQHRARLLQKIGLTPLGPLLGAMMSRQRLRKAFDEIYGDATKASEMEIDAHWEMIRENRGTRILHKLLQYIPERKVHRERWVGALLDSPVPLRLIDGGADPVSGAHLHEYYSKKLADADAVLLKTIGHYPHTEAPEEVAAAFFDFHHRLGTVDR